MQKSTAEIKLGFCECPGGADGACRHIAASLYALEAFEKLSVTDGPCLWKKRAFEQTEPVPIKKLRIESVCYGKKKEETVEDDFDPRHPGDRHTSQTEQVKFASELAEIVPSALALHLLSESNVQQHHGPEEIDQQLQRLSIVNRLKELASTGSGAIHVGDMLDEICYNEDEIAYIENKTIGQSNNDNWHYMRKGVITASIFKRIDSRARTLINNTTADPSKAVDCVLGKNAPDLDTQPAVVWGRKKEKAARNAYLMVEKKQHKNLHLTSPGLRISNEKAFIGGSADGHVHCKCHGSKLVEIKCPYKLRNKSPKEAAHAIAGFELRHGVWTITEQSDYYPQIQGLMGIYGLNQCDLVLYTRLGILVIPVHFKANFYRQMLQNLNFFYTKYVAPELTTLSP